MRPNPAAAAILFLTALTFSSPASNGKTGAAAAQATLAAPLISSKPAQNSAVIVSLSSTTSAATIYYTVDGTKPSASSQQYQAPFLVASNLTVNAVAVAGGKSSTVATQKFAPNIPSGTLVWSDEFSSATSSITQPDPTVWTYDTGNNGFGNHELENYCAWGSSAAPCSSTHPSEFVGTDGYLHIVAQQPSPGVYTSARLKTQGMFSFQYGRIEFRAQVPEAQGYWPAAWLMGNNIATIGWPACGEQDVLERVNAADSPDWNEGSVHGKGFTEEALGTKYNFPAGQTAAHWHTYGMIWSLQSVEYYIDDPSKPYATFSPASLKDLSGAVWSFDAGQSNFIILNLAIGGDWPGPPAPTTPFPSEMLVDYVRIYTN